MNFSNKLVVILGPTAVGKTKFAARLAYKFEGEIISADSRQVYIGMDIGTGKDLEDYNIHQSRIKTHLIDVVKPHCEFNLYLFTQLFRRSFEEIQNENHIPFLVGGTGLYLSSILQNYSLKYVDFNSQRANELEKLSENELIEILQSKTSTLHNTTDLLEKNRIIKAILIAENSDENEEGDLQIDSLVIGLSEDREILKQRIKNRLNQRLKSGMIDEVKRLLDEGITHNKLRFFGLEYKYLSMYLSDELSYNDMFQKLVSDIYKFAKRQMTWFRKMEKEGQNITWLNYNEIDRAENLISSFIN